MQSEETLVAARPPVKYYFTRNSVRNTTIYVPSSSSSSSSFTSSTIASSPMSPTSPVFPSSPTSPVTPTTPSAPAHGREVIYTVTTDAKSGKRTELVDARGNSIAVLTRAGFMRGGSLKGSIGKRMSLGKGMVKEETITWMGRHSESEYGDGETPDRETGEAVGRDMPASKWLWKTETSEGIKVHVVDTPHGALVWRSEEDGAPHRHAAYLAPDLDLARPVAWLVPQTDTSSLGLVMRTCAEAIRDEIVMSAIVLEQRMRVGRVAIGVFEQGRL